MQREPWLRVVVVIASAWWTEVPGSNPARVSGFLREA
jgi:hypothetical protein